MVRVCRKQGSHDVVDDYAFDTEEGGMRDEAYFLTSDSDQRASLAGACQIVWSRATDTT